MARGTRQHRKLNSYAWGGLLSMFRRVLPPCLRSLFRGGSKEITMLIRRPDIFITPEPDSNTELALSEQVTQPAISVLDVPDLPTIRQPATRPSKQQRNVFSTIQEWSIVGLLLFVALLARLFAAFHAGLEVDEPIFRSAASP